MAHRTRSQTRCQIEHLRRTFAQADGLPFADVLPADRVERAIRDEGAGWREVTFTPALILWAFLTQVLSPTACCRAAVGRVARLDPSDLLHRIRGGQSASAAPHSGDLGGGSERASLEAFLARLPDLWRAGEVRPTHRNEPSPPRTWRTHPDPFESAWPEILLLLQSDPQATAQSVLERFQHADPDRYPDGKRRTLQRRLKERRRVMARAPVHGCVGGADTPKPVVVGANGKA